MALPILKLNLVPAPTFWRRHHETLGWVALAVGLCAVAATTTVITRAYLQARKEGAQAVALTSRARSTAREEQAIQERLAAFDVTKELPRWKLAERVLQERSHPWSRITAELERSLVQDVRFKSMQRTRGEGGRGGTQVKIKGEAKSRPAEEKLIESLRANTFFQPAILEREAERQGGGIEFEITLPLAEDPPAWTNLPLYGPDRKAPEPPPAPKAAAKPAPKAPVKVQAASRPATTPSASPERARVSRSSERPMTAPRREVNR